jgi:hypothetical protein
MAREIPTCSVDGCERRVLVLGTRRYHDVCRWHESKREAQRAEEARRTKGAG